jgi:predicted deacylase
MTPMRLFATAALVASVGACAPPGANPPGTAAGRAVDRAAGTNVSGAYPSQSDGTRVNPPGTEASRAADRAAGTNVSGAYPSQSDGTATNPPGTAAGRTLDRALDTDRPTATTRPLPR